MSFCPEGFYQRADDCKHNAPLQVHTRDKENNIYIYFFAVELIAKKLNIRIALECCFVTSSSFSVPHGKPAWWASLLQ
jgi:hypothetical protein